MWTNSEPKTTKKGPSHDVGQGERFGPPSFAAVLEMFCVPGRFFRCQRKTPQAWATRSGVSSTPQLYRGGAGLRWRGGRKTGGVPSWMSGAVLHSGHG